MKPETIRAQTDSALSELRNLALRLSEERFAEIPSDGTWTLGQIYDHVIRSCMDLHLPYAEACLRGEGGHGRKRFLVAALFWMGGFPKIRVNPPRKVKEMMPNGWEPKSLTRKEALDGLEAVAKRMEVICSALPNSNPKIKMCHPPMGFLNASEWAQIAPIHLRHHLDVQIAHRKYLS